MARHPEKFPASLLNEGDQYHLPADPFAETVVYYTVTGVIHGDDGWVTVMHDADPPADYRHDQPVVILERSERVSTPAPDADFVGL